VAGGEKQVLGARGWRLRTEGLVPSGRGEARIHVRCGSDHRTPAIGESEIRMKSICFLPSAYCLLRFWPLLRSRTRLWGVHSRIRCDFGIEIPEESA
jgi:hypothetical protein